MIDKVPTQWHDVVQQMNFLYTTDTGVQTTSLHFLVEPPSPKYQIMRVDYVYALRPKVPYRDFTDDIPPDQIALLKKAFDAFDREKKGCISTEMVGTILEMLGTKLDQDTLDEIILEVDADGSGELEFEEFCTLAARFLIEEDAEAMQQELREAFRLYDKEGNGYITTGTLREILAELDDKLTSEDLDSMIEEIDSDGSGTVDFDEFMEVMTGE